MINIYCLYNTITEKSYIGQTLKTIEFRWKQHLRDARRPKYAHYPLYRSIQKYGKMAFELIFITSVSTQEDADNLEKIWIILLQSRSHNCGYNVKEGGQYKTACAPETKIKISLANMGRKRSAEMKAAMSAVRLGKKHGPHKNSNGCQGRILSEETKRKIGLKSKGRWLGKKHSPETRMKMAEARRRWYQRNRENSHA